MQVSIIIPPYNRAKDLDECLDSIIVQTTLPKEVIVVDDSDNDKFEAIMKQPIKTYRDCETYHPYFKENKAMFKDMLDKGLIPETFYVKYTS